MLPVERSQQAGDTTVLIIVGESVHRRTHKGEGSGWRRPGGGRCSYSCVTPACSRSMHVIQILRIACIGISIN